MTHSIKHLFHISAPKSKVFKAISTIGGLSKWWTVNTSGSTEPGGIIEFRFATHGGMDMKVTETIQGESVSWECVSTTHGWEGHVLTIKLDENDNKTRVRFSHSGWKEEDDSYAASTFSWGRYMVSLRDYCQAEKGDPFGGETAVS